VGVFVLSIKPGPERAKILSFVLFPAFLFLIVSIPSLAELKDPEDVALLSLEVRLAALKDDFEASVMTAGEQNPAVLQSLSWKFMSLAFVAAVSAIEPERYGDYFEKRQQNLEVLWKDKKSSWDHKAISAMRLCDEALAKLIVILADKERNTEALSEFKSIMAFHGVDSGKAKAEPARLAETKVFWSNRLVALFPLILKITAPDKSSEREDIMDDLLNRAEIIAARKDVHYQARLDLLYLNNVQSLTGMFFLLSALPDSSIREVATQMENELEIALRDPDLKVSDKISLSLVAASQMSFHLSLWYAKLG
jgi:hypothetical protein